MESLTMGDSLVIIMDKKQQGLTVGQVLTQHLRLPEGFLADILRAGRALVGNQRAAAEQVLMTGQRLRLTGGVEEPPGIPLAPAQAGALDIVYEDDHALVVNKPAGVLMYPGTPLDVDTLAHRVAAHYAASGVVRKVRHVHRLDRETTGIALYAKHSYSARTFDALLAERAIRRTYFAVVRGRLQPPAGLIDAALGRDRHVAGRYRVSATGKPTRTYYRTLLTSRLHGVSASLVACTLETGRTHQIRIHMAHRGAPVLGDTVYGLQHGVQHWLGGHGLHAVELGLWHPYQDQTLTLQAPVSPAFDSNVRELGFTSGWFLQALGQLDVAQNGR